MRTVRALTAGLLAALAVLVPAAAASAHDQLVGTNPADGARVAVAPDRITLTYDQPALKLGSVIRVLGPDGADVVTGDPSFVDEDVTQPLKPGLAAGRYRIEWQVTSADGHPIAGRLSFTVTQGAATTAPAASSAAAATTPAAAAVPRAVSPASDDDGGSGAGTAALFGVVALAIIAVVVGAAVLARRRGSGA